MTSIKSEVFRRKHHLSALASRKRQTMNRFQYHTLLQTKGPPVFHFVLRMPKFSPRARLRKRCIVPLSWVPRKPTYKIEREDHRYRLMSCQFVVNVAQTYSLMDRKLQRNLISILPFLRK